MRIKNSLVLIIMLVLLSGCMGVQTKVLDEINMVSAVSYDSDKDLGKRGFKATAVTPYYLPDKTVKTVSFSANSNLSKETRDKTNLQSDKPIFSGKLKVAIFSKEMAKQHLFPLTDTFLRDPSIGGSLILAVADKNASDIITTKPEGIENEDVGSYLAKEINHNIKAGLLPKTNLHVFTYAYYAEGADTFLPVVDLKMGKPYVKGIALFNEDKYVYQTKGIESILFKMLLEHTSKLGYAAKLDGDLVSIHNIRSKRSYTIKKPMTSEPITIHLKVIAFLREYSNPHPSKNFTKKIEKQLEQDIEKKGEKLIKKLQDLDIDSLGIGDQVRTRTRNWDKKAWEKMYHTIPIRVKANVKIEESGVIE
ncbi:Ger(x)C family spore germination protein [Peribacillus sp. SI8-4]|uniref:Ger(x)C family spore germination protein n=1 Tax=Peribacillus sp. SI8-4 TaxID=3048009 RepID=UPI0025547806|nr:Ger(x)C family spore germination protein [Peribacillus sp. SI8-4]